MHLIGFMKLSVTSLEGQKGTVGNASFKICQKQYVYIPLFLSMALRTGNNLYIMNRVIRYSGPYPGYGIPQKTGGFVLTLCFIPKDLDHLFR
jgi:hypothetical protein